MSHLITGIHHIALKCAGQDGLAKALAFYQGVLGLPLVRQWGEGDDTAVMLGAGDSLLELFANAKDAPGQGAIRHFALATADVDACAKAVEAAGYEVFVKPNDVCIASTPPLPARIAFCIGPVGEEIEFFQEK